MLKLKFSCGLAAAFVCVLVSASAHAQARRTWVSGLGNDADPCSRSAPCKTFAGALTKTAAGGEISTLDPAGYGAVKIDRSISITNDGAGEAGILVFGSDGIIVDAGPNDVVNLRGLIIDGGPPGAPGATGVRFVAGGALHIQNCVIRNFSGGAAFGVHFIPNTSAKLTMQDTLVAHNGAGFDGGGIMVKPTGGNTVVALRRVTIADNSNGLVIDTTATPYFLSASLVDSSATANSLNGVAFVSGSTAERHSLAIDRSTLSNNWAGVASTGQSSVVSLSNSVVTGNNFGLSAGSLGQIVSYGNNMLNGNFRKGAVTSTVPTE